MKRGEAFSYLKNTANSKRKGLGGKWGRERIKRRPRKLKPQPSTQHYSYIIINLFQAIFDSIGNYDIICDIRFKLGEVMTTPI